MKLVNDLHHMMLDILFPRRCPVCDEVMPLGGRLIHKSCEGRLKQIDDPYCMKCGRPLKDGAAVFCGYCLEQKHEFDRGISAYLYNDAMKASIYRLKYDNRQEYAEYYGKKMAGIIYRRRDMLDAGLIIPVPLYAEKLRKRGYNQAELLAAEISEALHIPMDTGLVERIRATRAQKELGSFERRKNLKKAFKIRKNDVKLNTVLVVDDIFTTGSTIDEVAGVLKEAGAVRVYAATLANGAPK